LLIYVIINKTKVLLSQA